MCLFSHLLGRDELLSHEDLEGLLKEQIQVCICF